MKLGSLFAKRRPGRRARNQSRRLQLDRLEDRIVLTTYTVKNLGDLASAIRSANNNGGPDLIVFEIPGDGVHTINTGSLPTITEALTIDGTTQPGYLDHPLIEISGTTGSGSGLRVSGSGTVLKGLALNNFGGSGIQINASNVEVQNCFIGVDAAGSQGKSNGGDGIEITGGSAITIGGSGTGNGNILSGNTGAGIHISGGASNVVIQGNYIGADSGGAGAIPNGIGINITSANSIPIGGPLPGQGNVISGNTNEGIRIEGGGNRNFTITGNFIGTNRTGTSAIGNGAAGISLDSCFYTQVGGTQAGEGNIIGSNGGGGIKVVGATTTGIFGNWIGTNSSAATNLGNKGNGVEIAASNVVVGGSIPGQPNVIAFNGDGSVGSGGVVVASGTNNPILSNQIYQNNGLGIDLGADGVTANDPGDADSGANNLQNFPILSQASTGAGRTLVQGTLSTSPSSNSRYLIQFFTVPTVGSTGVGQGQTLIGSEIVTTNPNGVATIYSLLTTPTKPGEYVTATATSIETSGNGNTSEFSPAVKIRDAQVADIRIDMSDTEDPANVRAPYDYVVTISNRGPDTATDVQVNVAIPSALSIGGVVTSKGNATVGGPGVTATIPSIAPGTSETITITVSSTLTGVYTVSASVTSKEIDIDLSNNTTTESTMIMVPTDLEMTLTQDPSPGVEGAPLTYVATVKNLGGGTGTAMFVTATLPPNVTFVSAASSQGSFQRIDNTIVADMGSLANGGVAVLRITVNPPGTGTYSLTATVTSNEDNNPSNNSQTLEAKVLPVAGLRVTGQADVAQPLGGETVRYTFKVHNDGPSDATNVKLTAKYDTDAFTFVSATTTDGQSLADNNGTITGTLAQVNSLGEIDLTIELVAKAGVARKAQVSATATTLEEVDLQPSDNTAVVTTPINAAELSIGLTAQPNPAGTGKNLTYTIQVRNDGPANASNIVVTFNYPVDADFVSASGDGASTGAGEARFTIPSLSAGETRPLTIVIVPRNAGGLTATARLTSFNALDTNPANDVASLSVPVSPADLAVTMSSSVTNVTVGDTIRYEVVVTNNGPVAAENVALVNTLPKGVRFVSATTTHGTVGNFGSDVSAEVGTLNPGESARVVIDVVATATGSLVNKARIGSTTYDSNPSNNQASTTVRAINTPGTIQFAQNLFVVLENASVVHLTINRTGGSQGTVSVNYRLSAGNALPGVNYTDVSGIVTFKDGETSQTLDVPILVDGRITGPLAFNAVLSQPTGGASLGSQSTSTVGIVNTDFDLVPPTVTDLNMTGTGDSIASVTLTFSEPLNPLTATYAPNFAIVASDGSRPSIYPPIYDAVTKSVTIVPTVPLRGGVFYYVVVNGQGFAAVQDAAGNAIDGDSNGTPGGDYIVSIARGKQLTYRDADGDRVNLGLSRTGYLEMIRRADGNGQLLRVIAPPSGRSVLNGTVRRQGVHGNGVTTIGRIDGIGSGLVNSRLTSPPFYVANQFLAPAFQALGGSGRVAPHATIARSHWARRGGV